MVFSSEMLDGDVPALGLDVGSNHTLAVNAKGQLFTWGVNICGQCGVNNKGNEGKHILVGGLSDTRVKQVACGDTHSLALDYEGNIFIWGNNNQGQLGNGKYKNIKYPYKLTNNIPSGDIKEISAKGNINIIINNEGKAYMWPTKDFYNEPVLDPVELPFTKRVILSISIGSNRLCFMWNRLCCVIVYSRCSFFFWESC